MQRRRSAHLLSPIILLSAVACSVLFPTLFSPTFVSHGQPPTSIVSSHRRQFTLIPARSRISSKIPPPGRRSQLEFRFEVLKGTSSLKSK